MYTHNDNLISTTHLVGDPIHINSIFNHLFHFIGMSKATRLPKGLVFTGCHAHFGVFCDGYSTR